MKIGIIICERYKDCAGGKCFRAMHKREGAFDIYPKEEALEIVGYARCGGCPGGNIEYAPGEMVKNGAEALHVATGFIVGYPPCPYIDYFERFLIERYQVKVVMGTHPIPQKYYLMHTKLNTWNTGRWQEIIRGTLVDEELRQAYD